VRISTLDPTVPLEVPQLVTVSLSKHQGGTGEKETKVRARDKRSAVAWGLFLLILLFTTFGDIVADAGDSGLQSQKSVSSGTTTPDTLLGGPGAHHGDPDDFDFVPPIGIWIQAVLMAVGH
jgi:hypothetical protein